MEGIIDFRKCLKGDLSSIESISDDPALEFDSSIVKFLDSSSRKDFSRFIIEEDQDEPSHGRYLEVRGGYGSCFKANTDPVYITGNDTNGGFDHDTQDKYIVDHLLLCERDNSGF